MIKQLSRKDHRHIIRRIIIRGILVLETPTALGSGDAEGLTDLILLRDSISNHALLTGSSIAGALRNYLHEYIQGYSENETRQEPSSQLFGHLFKYEEDVLQSDKPILKKDENQSRLIIDDAISNKLPVVELRDGVKINKITGTAEDRKKYDLELLEAGTEFPLCFELLIEEGTNESELIQALLLPLKGLACGEISIGMKKRRGFGRCKVDNWQVWNFNLEDMGDHIDWLTFDHSWSTEPLCTKQPAINSSIVAAMREAGLEFEDECDDQRYYLTIHAKFTLASPLLIRSSDPSSDRIPDVVHLKSRRNNELKCVLSGTALTGVLRHQAERIINTIGKNTSIVEDIFGSDIAEDKNKQAKASRLIVHESIIEETTALIQNRIAIDRFTGGTLHGALFNEQPAVPNDKTVLDIKMKLHNPKAHEIGLILLLLKDLWTGDLPVGGTSSIGRGRLQGKSTTINLRRKQETNSWTILQSVPKEPLVISDPESLEKFVAALYEESAK